MLVANLLITIAIILLLIMVVKMHPALSLFLGALYMGIASGVGSVETVSAITSGFGSLMTSLGFSVAFGVMMGHMLSRIGAVEVIANGILKLFSKKRAEYGLGLTGFIVSIPVFYDVGFVILVPLANALAKHGKSVAYYVAALSAGLAIAHGFIPPTPGPMTGAELVGIDVGTMIFWGIVVGLPTMLIGLFLYQKLFLNRKGFWNPEKDIDSTILVEAKETLVAQDAAVQKSPSLFLSLLPILLPIVLILIGTASTALGVTDNVLINFISNKNIALFIGLVVSMLIALSCGMDRKTMEKELSISTESLGTILFITGAGGSLAEILKLSGVGDTLVSLVDTVSIPPVLFIWLVAWLLKLAQGSSTVAMITAIGLIAPTIPALGINPVLVALAAVSGTLGACHVNDSGFWISTKLAGLTTSGGLKTYTLACASMSVVSLVIILFLSFLI